MLKAKLAARLAVCQIVGTFVGVSFAIILSRIVGLGPATVRSVFGNLWVDYAVLLFGGLLIGIPFYCIALLILHNATASILRRPFIACIAVPALLLAAALFAFPPHRLGGIFWMVLIPMSALFAGATFYVWLKRSPIYMANNSN